MSPRSSRSHQGDRRIGVRTCEYRSSLIGRSERPQHRAQRNVSAYTRSILLSCVRFFFQSSAAARGL